MLRKTTMRPGELRLLKWSYLQFDLHRMVFPLTVIKSRKRREVTMLDEVEEVLRARQKRLEALGLHLNDRYVFPLPATVDGVRTAGAGEKPQGAKKFAQRFRRLVSRCAAKDLIEKEKNGERLVPYLTRHTRITTLFVQGHDHAVVMHEAGHTLPQTTERYKHLAQGHVTDAIRRRRATVEDRRGK